MPESIPARIVRYAGQFEGQSGWLIVSPQAFEPRLHEGEEYPWGLKADRIVVRLGQPITLDDAWQAIRERDARVLEATPLEQAQQRREYENARAIELRRAQRRGFATGAFLCPSCGSYKSRPSVPCGQCGDEMLTENGSPHELDRSYGYE